MPNYPRPKSSIPKKGPRSSLHPHGAPSFAETIAGLKQGLLRLGTNLVGAGAAMAGNLIGPLTNLRKSAESGDEDAEKAYQEALAMLRGSGSEMADSLLRDLGEVEEEPDVNSGDSVESGAEASSGNEEPETAGEDTKSLAESSQYATVEDDLIVAGDRSAMESTEVPENAPGGASLVSEADADRKGKAICLECGAEFKRLTHTHLLLHGLDPAEYRRKHGLNR